MSVSEERNSLRRRYRDVYNIFYKKRRTVGISVVCLMNRRGGVMDDSVVTIRSGKSDNLGGIGYMEGLSLDDQIFSAMGNTLSSIGNSQYIWKTLLVGGCTTLVILTNRFTFDHARNRRRYWPVV